MNQTLSEIIRNYRKRQGFTQIQLGILMGVKGATVHYWETRGAKNLTLEKVKKLCEILKIEFSEIAHAA